MLVHEQAVAVVVEVRHVDVGYPEYVRAKIKQQSAQREYCCVERLTSGIKQSKSLTLGVDALHKRRGVK